MREHACCVVVCVRGTVGMKDLLFTSLAGAVRPGDGGVGLVAGYCSQWAARPHTWVPCVCACACEC